MDYNKLLVIKDYNNKNKIDKILFKPNIHKCNNNLFLPINFKYKNNYTNNIFAKLRVKLNYNDQIPSKNMHYVTINKKNYDSLNFFLNYKFSLWKIKKLFIFNIKNNIQKIKLNSFDIVDHVASNNSTLKILSNIFETKYKRLFKRRLYLKGQRGKFIIIKRYYKHYLNKIGKYKYKKFFKRFNQNWRWDDLKIIKAKKKMKSKIKEKVITGNIIKKRLIKIYTKKDENNNFSNNSLILIFNNIKDIAYKNLIEKNYKNRDKLIMRRFNQLKSYAINYQKFLNKSFILKKVNFINKLFNLLNNINYYKNHIYIRKKKQTIDSLYYFRQIISILYNTFNLKKWTYNFFAKITTKIKIILFLFFYVLQNVLKKNMKKNFIKTKNNLVCNNYIYLNLYYNFIKIFLINILKNTYLSFFQIKYKYIQNRDIILKKKSSNNYYVTNLFNSINANTDYIPNNYNSVYKLQYNFNYDSIIKNQEILYLNKYSNLKININKFFEDSYIREKSIKNNQYLFHLQNFFFNKYLKNMKSIYKHKSIPVNTILKENLSIENLSYKFTGVIDKFYKFNADTLVEGKLKHVHWLFYTYFKKKGNIIRHTRNFWKHNIWFDKKNNKIWLKMAKSLNYSLVKKPQNILKKRMQKHDKNKNKRQRFYFNSININIKLRKKLKKKIKFYKHACIDPNNVRLNVDKFISESKHLLPKSLGYHPDFIYKDLRQHIV